MSRCIKRWGVVILFAVIFLTGIASADLVSVCSEINHSGEYVLINDITESTFSNCIEITSSDVVLDGAGFTVDGIDDGNSYGVYIRNINDQLNNVTIKNITASDWGTGIYFVNVKNGNLTDNTANSNNYGIQLDSSSNNNLNNNTANSNSYGIYLSSSSNNNLTDNIADFNSYGMYLYGSNNNLTGNNVKSYYGIYVDSENNLIFNNRFNSTYNNFGYSNTLNTSKQSGENIIGGSYLGGNFWENPDGTGFSELCGDADEDGICDSQYDLGSGIIDYLPLTNADLVTQTPEINNCTLISHSGSYVLNKSIINSNNPTLTAIIQLASG